jgi:cobalt-zinc-cadmium efflux system outer membrane protein
LQARKLPNPELEVEVEEFDRGGESFDSAETSIALGQLIELGGKRRWRMRMAEAEGELAGWDYESKRLAVFAETTKRFTAILAAQRRLELAESAVELAEKTAHAVGERVKGGKEPPLQESKASAELELARLDSLEAESALSVKRKMLAAMWGNAAPHFQRAEGDLNGVLATVPSMEVLRTRLSENPELARWDAEMRRLDAELSSEKAERVPDLEARLGVQRFEEDGSDALAFGIGVPLPLFDRNQGNITAAQHELAKAKAQRKAAQTTLATELAEAHADLTSAHRRAMTLRSKVVPAMDEAFNAAHVGYTQGKFGFLDMLDAQRGLFEAKGELVNALADYHVALAEMQELTGTAIEELMETKETR